MTRARRPRRDSRSRAAGVRRVGVHRAWVHRAGANRARANRARARCVAVVSAAVLTVAVSGCTLGATQEPGPEPTLDVPLETGASGATQTSTPTPTPRPRFDPHDDAEQARAVFDDVNRHTLEENPDATGQELVRELVAAGFDQDDMQLTADTTSVGLDAGSIQFSVRWDESCLIGQNGEGSEGYHSELTSLLPTGDCLIGNTVAITDD